MVAGRRGMFASSIGVLGLKKYDEADWWLCMGLGQISNAQSVAYIVDHDIYARINYSNKS